MTIQRIQDISLSPTMRIAAKAQSLKSKGIDLVELNVGEPDLPTPTNIKQAARRALAENRTKYTVNRGLPELRQAICTHLSSLYNVAYNTNEIIVSNGAKQCIYNIIMTLIEKDDEVIIPGPYYPSYTQMVKLAQGTPVFLTTREEEQFKIRPKTLEKAISTKTRALIICNPANPTGIAYSQSELAALAEILEGRGIYLISDEVYSQLVYDNIKFACSAAVNSNMRPYTVIINGVSKAYAMTGWRIGFAAADAQIIAGADKIQSHCTSNAGTVSQYAALEAYSGPQESVVKMVNKYQRRRDYILNDLLKISGISCVKPNGAFYVFPNISRYYHNDIQYKLNNSTEIAEYLLDSAKVVVVPGAAFGSDDHIRISYSYSMAHLKEGIQRISKALTDLLP